MEKTPRSKRPVRFFQVSTGVVPRSDAALATESRGFQKEKHHVFFLGTLQGTNISHLKVAGKIGFLYHRWDMLYSS